MITGHRLCMKTAVADCRIFLPAIRTHGKGRHRCLLPVVRKITDDGKTRTAMRTVNKRVPQTMRLYLSVAKTFGTNGNIRCYLCYFFRIGTAGNNGKTGLSDIFMLRFRDLYAMDKSYRRMLFSDPGNKRLLLLRCQNSMNANTVIPVVYFPSYPHLVCNTIDKRTKANPLHQSTDYQFRYLHPSLFYDPNKYRRFNQNKQTIPSTKLIIFIYHLIDNMYHLTHLFPNILATFGVVNKKQISLCVLLFLVK